MLQTEGSPVHPGLCPEARVQRYNRINVDARLWIHSNTTKCVSINSHNLATTHSCH